MTTRYLLGYGERLTDRVLPPRRQNDKEPPYSPAEAMARLAPQARALVATLGALPAGATPRNEAVAMVSLHPQWIAKSYHPGQLLQDFGLRQVGSKPVQVAPEKWTKQGTPVASPSTALFVAGNRSDFADLAEALQRGDVAHPAVAPRIEAMRAPTRVDRIRAGLGTPSSNVFEVALHASEHAGDRYIVDGFRAYAAQLGVEVASERTFFVGGLCFLAVESDPDEVGRLADYSFLRVIRPMPRLEVAPQALRAAPRPDLSPVTLPSAGPMDASFRVAVFDGGLPADSCLSTWVNAHEIAGTGARDPEMESHGQQVTSAVLFGSVRPGTDLPRPFAAVDHYRVLDADTRNDPYELFDVLARVRTVLETRQHLLFNLSFGPAIPVEDDEVHAWTAYLDDFLSNGRSLATIAVGNTGYEPDPECRVQVPSDAVNALAVGAADDTGSTWARAPYSSVGPGRSPGVIKPDVVHFGGDHQSRPYLTVSSEDGGPLIANNGTSFAAPGLLRMAAGVRAQFGERIRAVSLKALMIHSAEQGIHERRDVGWGRTPNAIEDIMECGDGVVRVLYQGELPPGQYIRASVPLPSSGVSGMVDLTATIAFSSRTDPEDPGNYTRSGLDVTFRPNATRFTSEDAANAASSPFFRQSDFDSEHGLRDGAHKWETVLKRTKTMRATSLYEPVFDIHYNARLGGATDRTAPNIPYALVVEIRANRVPDLYERVVAANVGVLEPLRPVLDLRLNT